MKNVKTQLTRFRAKKQVIAWSIRLSSFDLVFSWLIYIFKVGHSKDLLQCQIIYINEEIVLKTPEAIFHPISWTLTYWCGGINFLKEICVILWAWRRWKKSFSKNAHFQQAIAVTLTWEFHFHCFEIFNRF